jgi:F-box protein 21
LSLITSLEGPVQAVGVSNISQSKVVSTAVEQGMMIDRLPDEILHQILLYVSPEDTLINLQRTSIRFSRLGNEPLLWRHHCRTSFRYWDSKHRIRQKFAGNAGDVDWKKIYIYRRDVDLKTTSALDGILSGQSRRIEGFERISQFGYDAKDTLLRHCGTGDAVEDVLSRR